MSQGTTPLINKPLVCARCITYNQAPYIVDAMNGFCMQQTTFPFVCAIIDDCSIDGEQEVIRNYLHKHFDLEDQSVVRNEETDDYTLTYARHKSNHNCFFAIVYLKYNHYSIGKAHLKNQYIKKWFDETKYIAQCEGDDYWTDPLKLQKQVDFLESHPECGLVYTDYSEYIQNLHKMNNDMIKSGRRSQVNSFEEHLLKAAYIAPPSWLYRRESKPIEEFNKNTKFIDGSFSLALEFFQHSQVFFMKDTTCVYRVLENSASHFKSWKEDYLYHKNVHNQQLFFAQKYRAHEDIVNQINVTFYKKYYKSILALNDIEEYSMVKPFLKTFGIQGRVASVLSCNSYLSRVVYTVEKDFRSYLRRNLLR